MDERDGFAVTLSDIEGLESTLELRTHNPQIDLVSRILHERGCWEPFETALWLACQQSASVAVDVGANLGYFSLLSARHFAGPARIIAFEPADDNYRLLCENLRLNGAAGRVEAVAAALGDVEEVIAGVSLGHSAGNSAGVSAGVSAGTSAASGMLYRSPDNLGDHQTYPGDGQRTTEAISILHGSSCLEDMGIEHIDVLKVDTQGSEYAVIAGLMSVLASSTPTIRILIELTPWSLRCAGRSGSELLALLGQLGLPVSIVDHLEHRLVSSSFSSLTEWSDNVDGVSGDRGFMNIFIGHPPQGF
ncbi:MAG: FkbM family methyltransferase [Congregibacter sp.]